MSSSHKRDLSSQGLRIAYALEKSGLDASAAAKKIGCKPQAISQWISGATKNIKNPLLFKFADATGVSARWLTFGDPLPMVEVYTTDRYTSQAVEVMEKLPSAATREEAVRQLNLFADFVTKIAKPPEPDQ